MTSDVFYSAARLLPPESGPWQPRRSLHQERTAGLPSLSRHLAVLGLGNALLFLELLWAPFSTWVCTDLAAAEEG